MNIPDKNRFNQAIQQIDDANKADPNQEEWNGSLYPKEILYARRMTERLLLFEPDASEVLQLAARCQHICRWEIPRADYPMTRTGYNQWRSKLRVYHADKAASILGEVGYDEATIERVKFLLLKKSLKRDTETQALEDVICLVFLEYYFDEFSTKYTEEKLIGILQKTWAKMSDKGHKAALELPLSSRAKEWIGKALRDGD